MVCVLGWGLEGDAELGLEGGGGVDGGDRWGGLR